MDWASVGIDLLKPFMAAIATALGGVLVAFLVQKLRLVNIQLTEEQQKQIAGLAKDAILRAEEYAAAQIKRAGQTKSQAPIGSKLDAAVADMQVSQPSLSTVDAERAIKSMLPQLGIGAAADQEKEKNAERAVEALRH